MSRIRFEIIPPVDGAHEPVFVSGNVADLGHWHPRSALALRWEPPVHVGTLNVPEGTDLEFKLTRGSWEREAVDAWGHVPENSRHHVHLDATIRSVIADWKDRYAGRLSRDRVHSDTLAGNRDLILWLPPEYADDPSQRFPVLYFYDGDNVFDPHTSPLSGVDWAADEWCRELTRDGDAPPTIVVGVRHPDGHGEDGRTERDLDLSLDYRGAAFTEFLTRDLVPYIDSRYRTLARPDARTLIGGSLGGLHACHTATTRPEVFGAAVCFSTVFADVLRHPVDSCPELLRLASHPPGKDLRLFFAYGDLPPDDACWAYHDRLTQILRAHGRDADGTCKVVQMLGGGHEEKSWRDWLGDALRFVHRGLAPREAVRPQSEHATARGPIQPQPVGSP